MRSASSRAGRRTIIGQSTLEYILVLAVVLLAIIAFSAGALRPAVQRTFNQSGDTIDAAAGRIMQGMNLAP